MNRRVLWASLLAFCLHGVLILAAQYRLSYDAYNHMFFADHYLRDWWSLWEPRWYTGFEVTSYPPLVHQFIAALGRLTGVDAAYALVLWALLTAYPAAVYSFSRIFTGSRPAGYAAVGAALLPSLYLSAHNFGQLPSLAGTLFALLGAAALDNFLRSGSRLDGWLAVSLFATTAAGHHAALLFQAGLALAVLLQRIVRAQRSRLRLFIRFFLFSSLSGLAALAVVWPFWEWGSRQALQTPIYHLSRQNFLRVPFAAVLFFLPMYGLLIPWIPIGLRYGLRKRYWGLGIAFLALFLLGLGDTTPLPRLFFGAGWAWLTYDRFAFWASLLLLPAFGISMAWWRRRQAASRRRPVLLGLMALTCLIIGTSPAWLPTQPQPIDMQPIVDFLARRDHRQYRYITLGFGDQLAHLSRLTRATTVDGSYHTARSLPELRARGIGQIDTAFWLPGGLEALDPILVKSGERGVRWGFVYLRLYVPVLERSGWVRFATLSNGIEVWENPTAGLPPPVRPPAENPFASFSWGTFPLLALAVSSGLAVRRYWPAASRPLLEAVKAGAAVLLPLGLTFWHYRTLFEIRQPRVYFTYSSVLFFLSDGLAVTFVLAWLIERLQPPGIETGPPRSLRLPEFVKRPEGWLAALCLLATLSTFWALDWRTSLYISFHLWLCFGLFLAVRDTPRAWRWFALGSGVALAVQVLIGVEQFLSQTTAQAASLGLEWPGELHPAESGASIVQLADGARWLRAYGTLPHPNLLGGFALALLAAPLAFSLIPDTRQRLLPAVLFNSALVLLVLTFSRSAWLGLFVLGAGLFLYRRSLNRKSLLLFAATGFLTLAILAVSLQPLFRTRLGNEPVQAEQVSNYTRFWLIQRAVELIGKNPLFGTGVGSFPQALSLHVADFYDIEPVHNVPLLVASELGVGGMFLLGGLAIAVAGAGRNARRPPAVVFQAALVSLAAVSLFDHYLWTTAPGRLLFAAMLGLWAGQVRADEHRR